MVGSSFEKWPQQMRMITPSFPCNGYHQTDLNAITPDSSPGFSLGVEHPSGAEYAQYLRNIVKQYDIDVWENTTVETVSTDFDHSFMIQTKSDENIHTQYLIWAGGEFPAPRKKGFSGSELCLHNSDINSWDECGDEEYIVIGCYESGVDAAYHLAQRGKQVTIVDENSAQLDTYDPSLVLSPYTSERLASLNSSGLVNLLQGFKVQTITKTSQGYQIESESGQTLTTKSIPINCTGFDINFGPTEHMFERDKDGFPTLNNFDESTLHRNLFLAGPKLKHGNVLLCFIYKFRGRFATPCRVIGDELELDTSILDQYRMAGMLLDDLTCCEEQECIC